MFYHYLSIHPFLTSSNDIASEMGSTLTFSERLSLSLQMLLLGMGTVFLVLAIIFLVMRLMKAILYDSKNKKKKAAEPVEAQAPATDAADEETPASDTDDNEIAAVISAAVAAIYADEAQDQPQKSVTGYRVVSFKRASSGAWNKRQV